MKKYSLVASAALAALLCTSSLVTAQTQEPKKEQAPAGATKSGTSSPASSPAPAAQATQDQKTPSKQEKPATSSSDSKGDVKKDQKSTTDTQKPGAKSATDSKDADSKKAADTKSGSDSKNTAAAAKSAAPPPEKRAQIATAIKKTNIKEVTNVNFNISIGARVPSTVVFHDIPTTIIEIYPEWRGYKIILVNGRYIIIRPQTYEIVYILEV